MINCDILRSFMGGFSVLGVPGVQGIALNRVVILTQSAIILMALQRLGAIILMALQRLGAIILMALQRLGGIL